MLDIQLIPKTAWYANVRFALPKHWDEIRKHVYKKLNGACYCCGEVHNKPLHAHELWKYVNSEMILVDIIPVCSACHSCLHYGRTLTVEPLIIPECNERIKRLNGFDDTELCSYLTSVFSEWRIRNMINWMIVIPNGVLFANGYTGELK